MIENILIPLVSLIFLEIILGVDNIIFISILSEKLPEQIRPKLRYWGLGLAVVFRLILLFFISLILSLDKPLFIFFNNNFSGKDIILILGGIFLLYKSTKEIYNKTERNNKENHPQNASFNKLLIEIVALDLVFSIDSIITALGMVSELWVMYIAVIVSMFIMLFASKPINEFILKHPSFKILALCFLMMIGVALLSEGLHFYIPKGYIYFAMAFSFLVDIIQMKSIKNINN